MTKMIRTLAAFLPNDLVFGESFRRAKKIHETFEATRDKMDFVSSYQREKLNGILDIAKKAPFYQYLNDGLQFDEIPIINKDIILDSFDDFVVSRQASDYITTGGTSGKPLGFYINKNRKGFEWFWMTNNWSKVGFNLNDYRAVLTNHKLGDKKYKVDRLLREYQYNNFALNDDYLKFITDHINLNKLKFLRAYPSAAYSLANYLKKEKKQTTLKTFLCGSENVFSHQKELIEGSLNIRMFTWYGLSEKVILAGEGKTCQNYHSNPFYGFTEIIDENNKPINEIGKVGELVGTGFMNTKMPFIRYKTGDFAEYVGNVCPSCGHIGQTFKNVVGRRKVDEIYKSDGAGITTTALNLHGKIYDYIKGLQYFQEEKGRLQVRVVPEDNFNEEIKLKYLDELKSKVGSGLEIKVLEVDSLEYTVNNKFQMLIQKIKKDATENL